MHAQVHCKHARTNACMHPRTFASMCTPMHLHMRERSHTRPSSCPCAGVGTARKPSVTSTIISIGSAIPSRNACVTFSCGAWSAMQDGTTNGARARNFRTSPTRVSRATGSLNVWSRNTSTLFPIATRSTGLLRVAPILGAPQHPPQALRGSRRQFSHSLRASSFSDRTLETGKAEM